MQKTTTPVTTSSLNSLTFTLALGIIITTTGFFFAILSDNQKKADYLQEAVNSIASASKDTAELMSATFTAIQQVFDGIQQDVAAGIPITQQRLQQHLWPTPPLGMENYSVLFLPKVEASQRYEGTAINNLLGNTDANKISIVEPRLHGVIDAGVRSEYFPVLVEASRGSPLEIPGIDRSIEIANHLAMTQARDSGLPTATTTFPSTNDPNDFLISYNYFPLYQNGVTPSTIQERREKLIGFVGILGKTPSINVLAFLPSAYHGVTATFLFQNDENLNTETGTGYARLKSTGQIKSATYRSPAASFDSAVIATATPKLATALETNTRWWILGLGLIVTSALSLMLLNDRIQANKVIELVKERTHDLAERTAALTEMNKALQESKQQYQMLENNFSDVIYTFDLDGICTYISPSITQLSGRDIKEYIGYPVYRFLNTELAAKSKANIAKHAEALINNPAQSFANFVLHYEISCIDGSIKDVETKVSLLRDNNGIAKGFISTMRDISDRKKAEEEKATLERAFRQSQKMEAVGTLAGGIAHDFNNLLTGVLGHAELLKIEFGGSSALRSVELIEMAATRAKELTGQLLGFARKGKFMQVPVDINKVLNDLTGLMEGTFSKKITITRTTHQDSPCVLGDPGQISQIFLNLAVNSRDAMPQGGTLHLKTEILFLDESTAINNFDIQSGNYCVITVTDSGIGIPEAQLERIFEPFFTTKEEGKGTGLGLSMVYGVVKNHKGAIHAYSELNKGTTIKVYLPLAETTAIEKASSHPKKFIKGNGRVLLVDDQAIVRQIGELMLTKLGYQVETADNGKTAMEYYSAHWNEIDLVMIDMVMPEMGGLECLDKMTVINPNLKAILATGFSRDDISETINENHVIGFIQKPYRLQELSEVVAGAKKAA